MRSPFRIVGGWLSKRRVWQWVSLLGLNAVIIGPWTAFCVPVLNCHSCPWAVFACPIGQLGHLASWAVFPLLALGLVLLFGALLGRLLCGWVCPFGLVQDLLHKIPSPKFTVPRWSTWIKYVLLASVVLVPIWLTVNSTAFYCNLCPVGTLESLIPRSMMEGGGWAMIARGWARIAVLLVILVFAVFSMRSFCKVLCPIGAILAVCNRFSGAALRYEQTLCSDCSLCLSECPMDVEVQDLKSTRAGDVITTAAAECILCLNCTKGCHQSGLAFSFWNLFGRKKA